MVAWCCANYLAFNTLGVSSLSLSFSHILSHYFSLKTRIYCDKSRVLPTLRWPVTRAASRVSFGLYARLLLTRNYQWPTCNDRQEPSRTSERERISIVSTYANTIAPIGRVVGEGDETRGGEGNSPCENIATLIGRYSREREKIALVIRAPPHPPRDRQADIL